MQTYVTELAPEGLFVLELEGTRYLLAAGGLSLSLFLLRPFIEGRRIQARRAKLSDRLREFGNSVRTLIVFGFIGTALMMLAGAGIIRFLPGTPAWWLFLLQIAGLLVAHDTYFYWMHRVMHRPRFFPRVHLTHHVSTTPTPWAAYSFSAAEAALEGTFLLLFLVIVPMHGIVIICFSIHQVARNVLGHGGYELMPSGFSRHPMTGWLTTSTHHDLHHQEGRYNYGLYFTWWDRWMGTEHPHYHERFEAAASGAKSSRNAAKQGSSPA